MTVSHLRFGPQPIRSSYLVSKANFVACHQWIFLERYDMLSALVPGGTFLLNSPFGTDEVWDHLPRAVQEQLIAKQAKFYVIDAYQVARDTGMGSRMNTILQVCFFAISKVLPREDAIEAIRKSIRDTYGRKGEEVVQKNMKAVDETLAHLFEVKVPDAITSTNRDAATVLAFGAEVRARCAGHDLCRARRRTCRSAHFRSTEPSPPAPRSGRSATWRSKFRRGIRRSASSAASAPWFVRMR